MKKIFAAAAAVAWMLAPARAQVPPQDSAAAAMLAKHRAYVGWHLGDGTFRSMRITGSVADEKGAQTQKLVLLSDGILYHDTYTDIARGGVTEHNGFTGRLFWQSNFNGFTTPIYGDYAKYLASLTMLRQEGTTELGATYAGERRVDGKPAGVVRVTLTNGDPIDLYVDPATGAYLQATIDPGGSLETTIHILSYADVVPGKKMISSYRIGKDRALYTYDKFEPNVSVTPADLHPPAAKASWTFASQPFPVTLTRNRVLINATVNGVVGRFILDTGASAIVMDDRFADRAKASALAGSGEAFTLYGNVKIHTRRVDAISFGGSTLHNVLVASEDFESHDYRGLDRAGYDGLIGYDLFAGAVVKLNVYDSTMTILDPAEDLSASRGLQVLVDLSHRIPGIPITLNGSLPVIAFLDTGNPGVAFLSFDFAKSHDLRIGSPVCGNLESLTIGPIVYKGQPVCLESFRADYMLLGYDFLKHFDLVFDYPHGRMFMMPNKN
ncbi:MAG: pepsin/retropepsin-like aspartic protease family protein [Candidatus Cybelea sp.]